MIFPFLYLSDVSKLPMLLHRQMCTCNNLSKYLRIGGPYCLIKNRKE